MPNPITSAKVSRKIARELYPYLESHGFTKFKGRQALRYDKEAIVVFWTSAVGNHFADITGMTPMSFSITVGVHYLALGSDSPYERDKDGAVIYVGCDASMEILCPQKNVDERTGDMRRAERDRNDVWWIALNGKNLDSTVKAIEPAFSAQAVPWLRKMSDPRIALNELDKQHDCPAKYDMMFRLATHVGNTTFQEKYRELYETKCDWFRNASWHYLD